MRPRASAGVLCAAVLALAGCGGWMGGGEEDDPLPGERVSVLTLDDSLEPDQRIQDLGRTIELVVEQSQEGHFGARHAIVGCQGLDGAVVSAREIESDLVVSIGSPPGDVVPPGRRSVPELRVPGLDAARAPAPLVVELQYAWQSVRPAFVPFDFAPGPGDRHHPFLIVPESHQVAA